MEGIYFPEREVLICDEVLRLPKTKDEGRRTHCFAHAGGKPRGAGAGSSALVRLLAHAHVSCFVSSPSVPTQQMKIISLAELVCGLNAITGKSPS